MAEGAENDEQVDFGGETNMGEGAKITEQVDFGCETNMAEGAKITEKMDLGGETNVGEGSEIDERVDLDEENYMEEIDDDDNDDDVEERVESDREDQAQDGNSEKENEDSRARDTGRDQLEEDGGTHIANDIAKDEKERTASTDDPDREKHAHLLGLPPHGSQIFIGGLPKSATEEDLRDYCEPLGEIFEIRLVKNNDTGESKGYAFISFTTKEAAQKAVEDLHDIEFKGKTLRCSLSESKYRLFINNIPKSLTEDEFRIAIEETGLGSENIELIKDPQHPGGNCGFVFVEYYNNACADYSRKKMSSANFKLYGNTPNVTWADPKSTSDHSAAAAKVKALYVKNIPDNTTTEQVKELFQRHGEVTKVAMPLSRSGSGKKDFGFVHYADRSSALKAVKNTEKYEISGQILEVTLAKPQADKKFEAPLSHCSGVYSNSMPHISYAGYTANQYGSVGAGYGVSPELQQPMIYGRGLTPAGMNIWFQWFYQMVGLAMFYNSLECRCPLHILGVVIGMDVKDVGKAVVTVMIETGAEGIVPISEGRPDFCS